MRTRLMRLALAALLLSVLLVPAYAGAQDGEIAFPPVGDGTWGGVVHFSGYISSDTVRGDGSFGASVTDVIDDTTITLEFVVDDNGQVTSGTMTVDLTYFIESAGTSPSTFDTYYVTHDQHQTGTLTISGNANRLVAAGTLTHESITVAEGSVVEEVSGTEMQEVEWVFQASEASCVLVTADLVSASGISLVAAALLSGDRAGGRTGSHYDTESHYALTISLLAWPADDSVFDDPEAIKEALEEIALAADGIHLREYPEASHLLELVQAWDDLKAELAGLDECQTTVVGWVPESNKSWLVDILQEGLNKALDNPDYYEAVDFIDLWVAGLQVGAVEGNMDIRFLDVFFDKLNEAIANNDNDTIYDILSYAAAYNWSVLYAQAKAALEGGSG